MMKYITKLLYRELYKKSLYDFVRDFWNTCDSSKFIDSKLIKYYCEIFQYFCRKWTNIEVSNIIIPDNLKKDNIVDIRQNKQNLCLNVPPRHTKSKIFNIFGPVWLWLSYPIKAVSISHTRDLATEMNKGRYNIINSDKFKNLFDDIILTTNSTSLLGDSRGGELRSLNRNAFTGYGGDIIINDDLTNAETARKDMAEMENAWSYYKNTMPSRINDINKCIIMNIQQRLAPNDITGHILNDENLANAYTFVTLPAYFSKTTHYVCPISGEIITWEKGEYLWPERFNDYSSIKDQVGNSVFETQYLQNPIASDNTIIKPDMIVEKSINEIPSINDADVIYASHDFPIKDKDKSDYLGSILAYKIGSTIYIKDCLEKRMGFVKSVEYVTQLNEVYPGIIQIIEDKANGSPILQQLQDKIPGLQAYQPGTQSKTQRLESASLYMTNNSVIFVQSKFNKLTQIYSLSDDLENLKQRLLNFPFVEHDDIIDAFSMLLLFTYMDRRFMVYGRSFSENNIYNNNVHIDYSNIFFNKEGDIWKMCEIGVKYGESSVIYVMRENMIKGSIQEGFEQLKEFAGNKNVLIDCSFTESLIGLNILKLSIEKYNIDDFDKSVAQLNTAFSKHLLYINSNCKFIKADIENFKFSKSKDENVKYITQKDGFVSCLRTSLLYYGV